MDVYSSLIDNIKLLCDYQHLKGTPVLTGGFEAASASVSSLCSYFFIIHYISETWQVVGHWFSCQYPSNIISLTEELPSLI